MLRAIRFADVDEAVFGKTPLGGQMRQVNVRANYFVNQHGDFGVNRPAVS